MRCGKAGTALEDALALHTLLLLYERLAPLAHAPVGDPALIEPRVGMEQGPQTLPVGSPHDDRPDQLDVLPRHRPLSIPRGGTDGSPFLAARRLLASRRDEADAVALVLEAWEVAPASVRALVPGGRQGRRVGDDEVAQVVDIGGQPRRERRAVRRRRQRRLGWEFLAEVELEPVQPGVLPASVRYADEAGDRKVETPTFSCDIAYPERPAASSASCRSPQNSTRAILPSRTSHTEPEMSPTSASMS
jgi:hypothetical protein